MPIPKYAAGVQQTRLVLCICRNGCSRGLVYAKVSKATWKEQGASPDPELYATCLKCGYQATDEYNWIRV